MCVFCEIIKGNIPSKKIYEDNDVLAILDISQATVGHTLVLPKNHYENLYDIDEEVLAKIVKTAKKIAKHYKEVDSSIEGINLLNNNEETAGQSVMHYHMHVLPRRKNDDLQIKFQEHQLDLDNLQKKYQL